MYSEFLDWGIMLYEREFGFYVKIKFQKNLEFSFYAKNVVWSLWLFLVLNFSKGSCQMNKFLLRIPITSIQQKALIWAHLKPADMILWINFQIPGHFKNTGRIEPLKQGKRTHCTCIFYFPLYAPLGPLVLTKREG